MSVTTYLDEANRLIVHYATDLPQPTRFVVWLEGRGTTIEGRPGELPSAVWQRVVDSVRHMREGFARVERLTPKHRHAGMHQGNPYREGNVYAGIDPTRQQVQAHLRQWMVWVLYKHANSPSSTDMQKVNALSALAEIVGLVKPDPQRRITVTIQ
jgi:hypothetical protein